MIMPFLDPATRNIAISGTVGAGVTIATGGCLPCGGAAAGALRAKLAGRGALSGAIGGAITQGLSIATEGDLFVTFVVGGAASGAAQAAVGGGDVLQAAILGASVGTVSAVLQYYAGYSPEQAQAEAQEQQTWNALSTDHANIDSEQGGTLVAQMRPEFESNEALGIGRIPRTLGQLFEGDKGLSTLGQISAERQRLEDLVPLGETRRVFVFIDKSTGNVTGSSFGPALTDPSRTFTYGTEIEGRAGRPYVPYGR